MDKLYAGVRPVSVIAEMIIAVLNTNVHVYHTSPFFTMVELKMIQKLGSLMGYQAGVCGGFFLPGGSYSNLHALITARNFMFPEYVSTKHISSKIDSKYRFANRYGPLQVITSSSAHYSVKHACLTAGLMPQNIIGIDCDIDGCIFVDDLQRYLQSTLEDSQSQVRPFFLHITAGTTVLGSFDNIKECVNIAHKYGLWVHLDASWGGSLALSSNAESRVYLSGSDLCDSITWNPHKLMGIPLLCSALLLKVGSKAQANSLKVGYLFHNDADADSDDMNSLLSPQSSKQESSVLPSGMSSWDIGQNTLGCGRRADAFKLFLTWAYEGQSSFSQRVDLALANAKYLYTQLNNSDRGRFCGTFIPFVQPQFTNVTFWWVPSYDTLIKILPENIRNQVRDFGGDTQKLVSAVKSADYDFYRNMLSVFTRKVHHLVRKRGKFMIDYAPFSYKDGEQAVEVPQFWRAVFNNPLMTRELVDQLMTEIDAAGSSIGWISVFNMKNGRASQMSIASFDGQSSHDGDDQVLVQVERY
ncbi:hypothetical protein MIR68_004898 [Amoeboaphelidium protococcarum]|nr:hypothetical protein MIR68_004898 [Amoeboaphelidium protococcarum]